MLFLFYFLKKSHPNYEAEYEKTGEEMKNIINKKEKPSNLKAFSDSVIIQTNLTTDSIGFDKNVHSLIPPFFTKIITLIL